MLSCRGWVEKGGAPWTQEVGVGFEGWGPNPDKVGARRVGRPKISRFFPSPAAKIRSFLPSLGVFSLNFGGVFEAPGRSNVHVWALQTCTFEGPGLQKHHQNSTRRPPEREEKNEFSGGRGKKERNFGRSRGRAFPGRVIQGAPNRTKPKP